MGLVENLLKQHNASLDDLSQDEMNAFFNLLKQAESKELDLPKFKVVLRDLITALEREFVVTDEWEYFFFGVFRRENRKHLYIKARLDNYLILENILSSPERARRAMEEVIERLGKKAA